jgi:hypothetical protein
MRENRYFICGLMIANTIDISKAIEIVNSKISRVFFTSNIYNFDYSTYYKNEFGDNLKKILLVGERLEIETLNSLKILSNKIETQYKIDDKRTINIDPGFMTLSKIVLYTTKKYAASIPINEEINAIIELVFENSSYQPLNWTYPDYSKLIPFFNSVRKNYIKRLKNN